MLCLNFVKLADYFALAVLSKLSGFFIEFFLTQMANIGYFGFLFGYVILAKMSAIYLSLKII